eukprot:Rhum_TRINITY_DN10635_c1_g1::Rhum_TRINITY_DN10635_c1_g1_i1::g.39399::m.39399/K01534/zntA; Cd2+/Zn2+-exporting ATPase
MSHNVEIDGERTKLVDKSAPKGRVTARFYLGNLCCEKENKLIEQAIGGVDGVTSFKSNVVGKSVAVVYNDSVVGHDEILRRLNEYNLGAVARGSMDDHAEEKLSLCARVRQFVMLSPLFTLQTVLMVTAWYSSELIYYTAVLLLGILGLVIRKTCFSPKGAMLKVDMELLILVASLGTIYTRDLFEGATMVYTFSFSKFLQSAVMGVVQRAIDEVCKESSSGSSDSVVLADTRALLPLSQVRKGTKVLVFGGEVIPVDGVVTKHGGNVDESCITGESVPLHKEHGAKVMEGSLLLDGVLEVQATAKPSSSSSTLIEDMITESASSKTEKQDRLDHVASVYSKVILLAAVGYGLAGLLMGEIGMIRGSLVLVVLGCPCALVMAGPIVSTCGVGALARHKVFVKNCGTLDDMARITAMCFDKTGTLTEGSFDVQAKWLDTANIREKGFEEKCLVSLQSLSSHPVSHAITSSYAGCMTEAVMANGTSLALPPIDSFKILPGKGLEGEVAISLEVEEPQEGATATSEQPTRHRKTTHHEVHMGSLAYMRTGVKATVSADLEAFLAAHQGTTIVCGSYDRNVVVCYSLSDGLRTEAASAVSALRDLGIASEIVSGDKSKVVERVVAEVGLSGGTGELLPSQKVDIVVKRQRQGETVAFAGDGLNDAPSLATADVGYALSLSGRVSAIPTAAAPVVLTNPNLMLIPESMLFSRTCHNVFMQNVAISLVPKLLLLAATLLSIIPPHVTWAVFLDALCLLCVTLNGLRLLCKL